MTYTPQDLADKAEAAKPDEPLAWHLTEWANNEPDHEEDTASRLFMLAVTQELTMRKA